MQDSLQEIPEMMELALAEAVVDASQKELELEGKELLDRCETAGKGAKSVTECRS